MHCKCRITCQALTNYRNRSISGRIVVIDTETTGISETDEVIQIAAVEFVDGQRARTFCCYVVPSCPVDPGAEAVHHISRAFLEENGLPPCEALARFFEFVGSDALVVGHNVRFDVNKLQYECEKFGFASALDTFEYCDTLALAKKLVPGLPHYRLCMLLDELGIEGSNSHDALDDTLACAALYFNLVRRIPTDQEYGYEPDYP